MRNTTKGLWLLLAGLSVAATGCAYGYAEEASEPEEAYAQSEGPPVLQYALPVSHPKGKVYVVSLGLENVPGPGPERTPEPMLHFRIAVENDGDVNWTLDPGEMTVAFDGGPPVYATYAQSTPRGGKLTVAAGKRGDLDLYFLLPENFRPARADLTWLVHRDGETITTTSRFDVLRGPSGADVYYRPIPGPGVVYMYGPGWWWGPYWDWGLGWWGSPWWWGGWYGPRWYGHWHRPWYGGYRGGFRGGGFRGGGGFHGGGLRGGGSFRGGGGYRGAPMGRGPRR